MSGKQVLTHGIFINGFANSESLKFLNNSSLKNPLHHFPEDGSNLTIVILSFNRVGFTIRLIDSLQKHVPDFAGKILIMDNGSAEDQLSILEERLNSISTFEADLIKLGQNFGVAQARNKAMAYVKTEWFLSLDNDIYFIGNPLPAIKDCIESLGVFFLNVPLLQTDGKHIDAYGGNLWLEPYEDSYFISGTSSFKPLKVDQLPQIGPFLSTFIFGGASVINKNAFLEHGCYDGNMFIGFEDTELSLRLLHKGIKIGNIGSFDFIHAHQAPKNNADVDAEKVRFSKKLIHESGEYFKKKHGLYVLKPSVDGWIEEKNKELKVADENVLAKEHHIEDKQHLTLNSGKSEIIEGLLEVSNTETNQTHGNVPGNLAAAVELYELQEKLKHAEYQLNAIKTSKFWKLRNLWFRQRQRLGITNDGVAFSLKDVLKKGSRNKTDQPSISFKSSTAYDYEQFLKKIPVNKSESNILVFIPFMVVGGAETAILQVLKGFKKHKLNTSLIVSNHPKENMGDTSEAFYNICPDAYVLEDYNTLWNDADCWKHWKNLTYALIKDRNIDVLLISNSSFGYLMLEDIKRDFPHIKVINPIYSTVGHMIDNIKYEKYIDMTVVENPTVETYLIKDALRDPKKVKRIENGVDLKQYQQVKFEGNKSINNHQIPDNKIIISYLGRLSEEKGPDIFLDIAEACKFRSDLHFVLAGDGPMREEIKAKLSNPVFDSLVSFVGFANSKTVLAQSDIMLVPSRMDGRPNVVLESLAMGVPVIASNVGGLPWIISEANLSGIICPAGDTQAFKDAICRLVDTPGVLQNMKVGSRKYAERELDVRITQKAYNLTCLELSREITKVF
ncbi:glycosyltransferase [Rufibacter tibetensis]|uniref:glycosyltransferase n=1 Tax=Rufibacter tibetensis TaxID=512763 RepID=UPI00078100E7|nr:glycosyltransferase [Rufibacter tibetensis]